MLEYEFRKRGARAGYPSIVAAGSNACILHYIENNSILRDGDLILVDAGAEKHYMNSDVTRVFPAGAVFPPAKRDLYEIVLEVQKDAISRVRAGSSMAAVHEETVRRIAEGLRELGLLQDPLEKIIEEESYKKYFMHGTGHWLGADVHDVGLYYIQGEPRALRDGMVCTVEPGIYIPPEDESAPPELQGVGIRIEDDVLVQGDEPVNLTAAIPREIREIEALRTAE